MEGFQLGTGENNNKKSSLISSMLDDCPRLDLWQVYKHPHWPREDAEGFVGC